MYTETNTILLTLNLDGRDHVIQTSRGKYDSLLCLIDANFSIRRFGICYGGGCCGTCGVVISEKGRDAGKFVLSCEVQVDEEIANKRITIL